MSNPVSHQHAATRGFTLVELAVVLSIIAIMVAGIMASSSLMRSSALQNVGHEIGDLQKGINEFQELYGALPGDMPNATELFRCTACNGNGNGRIDQDEQDLVLEHLSRAKLLKAQLLASNQGANRQYPDSAAASGAIIALEARPAVNPERLVAVIRMNTEGGGAGPLSAQEAQSIDRRMDDGDPYNGRIVVEPALGASVADCKASGQYTGSTRANCNLAAVLVGKAFSNATDKNTEYQWVVQPQLPLPNVGTWTPGAWGDCSQSCGSGVQTRSLTCVPGTASIPLNVRCVNIMDGTVAGSTSLCMGPTPATTRTFTGCMSSTGQPPTQRACTGLPVCPYGWQPSAWSSCKDKDGAAIANGDWEMGNWGNCSKECGTGTQTRKVYCRERKGVRTRTVDCPSAATNACDGPRPPDTEECSVSSCGAAPSATRNCNTHDCSSGWKVTPWGDCTPAPSWSSTGWSSCKISNTSTDRDCGGPGVQTRTVSCVAGGVRSRGVSCIGDSCSGAAPASTEACDYSCAGERPADVSICYTGQRWGDVYNSASQVFRYYEDTNDWVGCLSE